MTTKFLYVRCDGAAYIVFDENNLETPTNLQDLKSILEAQGLAAEQIEQTIAMARKSAGVEIPIP